MRPQKILGLFLITSFILEQSFVGLDLVLLTLLAFGQIRPFSEVVYPCLLAGIILDLFSHTPFGTNAIFFLVAVFITKIFLKKGALTARFLPFLPVVFIVSLSYEMFISLILQGRLGVVLDFRRSFYNTVASWLILKILFFLRERRFIKESLQLDLGL